MQLFNHLKFLKKYIINFLYSNKNLVYKMRIIYIDKNS